jgi:membrane protein
MADRPRDMPTKGWFDVLKRVKDAITRDNASLVAAGLALYALLAAFPALAAVVSLYGLFASPEQIASQFETLRGVLPQQATEILTGALTSLASRQGQALGVGAVLGFVLALWSARKGMDALMKAMNIAYDEEEHRGFFRRVLVSLAFTLGAVVGFVLIVAFGVAVPLVLESLSLPGPLDVVVSALRWALMWLIIVLALAVVYRYAPDRDEPKWRWVTWGSAIAATLWIVGSALFTLYVRNSASYGETYGALGGVVVLLLWLYLTGFIVMLGAEINSELEHQTARDTTKGRREPIGRRGAHVADTVGEAR